VTERPPAPEPLAVEVPDAHCHLDLMQQPVEQVLSEAKQVGINKLVTIGIDVESSAWCARTAALHDDVFAAVAIHPNEASRATDNAIGVIAELAKQPKVRAVGETGLDYYRNGASQSQQEQSFRAHIRIAREAGKALVIHDRDAHGDVLRILEQEATPEHVVFHCFSGDDEMASVCAERGYVMSFAGNVTFKNAPGLRAAAAIAPIDHMLVETDAPFLTPMPYRGRPNAPYLVPLTVRAIAAIKQVSVETVARGLAETAAQVFGW
jgi:TatD DNase family protein